jgi:hypothetical protein
MVSREYGQYLKPTKVAKDKFKPVSINMGYDISTLPNDVVDAVTVAGQLLDTNLTVTSPKGSSEGVSIVTAGMDDKSLAELTGALVDGGFTGFEETEGVLHVSMQAQVPSTFGDEGGKPWGGWTYLSPSVLETLKEKGFAPGVDASAVKRNKIQPLESDIDYGKPTGITDEEGKPTSSALGIAQFIDSTWLRTIKRPDVAAVMGIDLSQSDGELLELRKNPELAIMASAALARDNNSIMKKVIGRDANAGELYMAHFLGANGAIKLIQAYKNMPDQRAKDIFPEQAKANKPVFEYKKTGKHKTIAEVYEDIESEFTLTPTQVAYEDVQLQQKVLAKTEKALAEDPISHASKVGSHQVNSLEDENGFAARSATALNVANYYNIPEADIKPFTQDEAIYIKEKIDNGTTDEVLQIMEEINTMGPKMSVAAAKQLEAYDPVFAHAADLKTAGHANVASQVVRGQKRLQENPEVLKQIDGATETEIAATFIQATEGALYDVPYKHRQAIQQAAIAHYVQQGYTKSFKGADFKKSVNAVLGGSDGRNVIASVNGYPTLLPSDMDENTFEAALDNIGLQDLMMMSPDETVPRYADGTVVDLDDIRDEVKLVALGNDEYNLMLEDGQKLVTDQVNAQGMIKFFIFKPDADRMRKVASRPSNINLASVDMVSVKEGF